MNEMVQTFAELTGCPLWQAVRMASLTPAEIVGVADEIGSLARGKRADIVVIDGKVNVLGVYLSGISSAVRPAIA
jgi:N-acetylglucosamine-6-phosphate deacetylase